MRHFRSAGGWVVLFLLVSGLRPHPAPAQSADAWVGKRVITHYGTVLKVGGKVVDDAGRGKNLARGKEVGIFRAYRVERVNGPWLWLVAEESGARGWAKVEQVIPFDQAIDYFTAEIRANPGSTSNYIRRGDIWGQRHEYDIAIADFNEAIRLDPGFALAYSNRGTAWYYKKEYDKAIADCNEAIRLDPGDATAYNNRGNAWQGKKEYDKAIADHNEAIRLDPQNGSPYNSRAWLWATCPDAKSRDGKRAVASATRACELTLWKDADDLGTLAASYAEAGDIDKAVEWQEKAIALDGDQPGVAEWKEWLEFYRPKKPYREEPGR